MDWYEAFLGLRAKWDGAPALRAVYPDFDAWSRWMVQCAGSPVIDDRLAALNAWADTAAEYARERLALVRDPAAYLPSRGRDGLQAALPTIFEDAPSPTLWLWGPICSDDRVDLMTPRAVRLALRAASDHLRHGEPLRLRISSPGGDMTAAGEIARLLSFSRWGGMLVAEIDHHCYSAAAVILLPVAGRVVMRENATLMLHEPSRIFFGRAGERMRQAREQRRADELDWQRFADVRRIPFSRVRRLALSETFLSADQALRLGLVDEISPALPALNVEEQQP